jgi:putative membrane protein
MGFKLTKKLIIAASIIVPGLVFLMFYFPSQGERELGLIKYLPRFNATINSITGIVLILGKISIARGQERRHRNFMMAAFFLSATFLISYVIYHSQAEPTLYRGEGIQKYLYFILLISHILLAAIILPLILFAVYHGLKDNRNQHKRIVKWTFPIWLYVSISGVLVYLLLSPYYTH